MVPNLTVVLSLERWLRALVLAVCAFLVTPNIVGAVEYDLDVHVYDGEVQSAVASVGSGSTASAGHAGEETARARTVGALVARSRLSTSSVAPTSALDDLVSRGAELRARVGSNRVTIDTPNGRMTVDLEGKAHFEKSLQTSVDTPHVKFETRHVGPGGNVSYTSGPVRPATHDDLRLVERALDLRGQ